jgi:hypothetical protein
MPRITVRLLLTSAPPEGLGYCCPWFFFTHFKRTARIADRLGVTCRAIQIAKAEVREGKRVCEGHPDCMHKKMTLTGTRRK